MSALVADYGSASDSESDNDAREEKKEIPSTNYLEAPNDGSSSESETEAPKTTANEVEKSPEKEKLPNPLAEGLALPSPSIGKSGQLQTSVFVSKYAKAEEAKNSILEQHVKMTTTAKQAGKTKQLCWNFQKGKCRKGSKCKFSHDNEIPVNNKLETEKAAGGLITGNSNFQQFPSAAEMHSVTPDEADDDSYMGQAKRKHRTGIRDHLVPPKRAMTMLDKQRIEERPWTMKR